MACKQGPLASLLGLSANRCPAQSARCTATCTSVHWRSCFTIQYEFDLVVCAGHASRHVSRVVMELLGPQSIAIAVGGSPAAQGSIDLNIEPAAMRTTTNNPTPLCYTAVPMRLSV